MHAQTDQNFTPLQCIAFSNLPAWLVYAFAAHGYRMAYEAHFIGWSRASADLMFPGMIPDAYVALALMLAAMLWGLSLVVSQRIFPIVVAAFRSRRYSCPRLREARLRGPTGTPSRTSPLR